MNDEAYIFSSSPVARTYQPFMNNDGIGTTFGYLTDNILHIQQALDGPAAHPVVHRDNHRLPGIPVDNSLQSDFFAYHIVVSLPSIQL
jgi:hypothetical protein